MATPVPTPELTLYTAQAPNGGKVSIALEELGLPYTVRPLALNALEQKEPWYLAINPNGRIPALTDATAPLAPSSTDGAGKGEEEKQTIHLMESGAILLYLAENYDPEHKLSFPRNSREHWEMVQWVIWQAAQVGPLQGQAIHFLHYAPTSHPYATSRYIHETLRLYAVLERRLTSQSALYSTTAPFLVGNKFSMADVMSYPWVACAGFSGVDVEKFPRVKDWEARLMSREGVRRGHDVPEKFVLREVVRDEEMVRRAEEGGREWIQGQMRGLREGDLR